MSAHVGFAGAYRPVGLLEAGTLRAHRLLGGLPGLALHEPGASSAAARL